MSVLETGMFLSSPSYRNRSHAIMLAKEHKQKKKKAFFFFAPSMDAQKAVITDNGARAMSAAISGLKVQGRLV